MCRELTLAGDPFKYENGIGNIDISVAVNIGGRSPFPFQCEQLCSMSENGNSIGNIYFTAAVHIAVSEADLAKNRRGQAYNEKTN